MPTLEDLKVQDSPKLISRLADADLLRVQNCGEVQSKKCGAHYKQLAFVLPFLSVYLMYSCTGDSSAFATAVALTAGTLAGAVSFGLYRAIKIARHSQC